MTLGLEIRELTVDRGALTICHDINLTVPTGEITVLLGANGSGKTTLLDGIMGLAATTGSIKMAGRRIDAMPTFRRAAHGIAYVEQGRTVFARLTVAQNLAVVDRAASARERAFALFPQLADKQNVQAGQLSGGEQQMLAIARALASNPKVLLLDELSLGLAPGLARNLINALPPLAEEGTGILLVEQYAHLALSIGTTVQVMQHGRIRRSEACATVLNH